MIWSVQIYHVASNFLKAVFPYDFTYSIPEYFFFPYMTVKRAENLMFTGDKYQELLQLHTSTLRDGNRTQITETEICSVLITRWRNIC